MTLIRRNRHPRDARLIWACVAAAGSPADVVTRTAARSAVKAVEVTELACAQAKYTVGRAIRRPVTLRTREV